MLTKEELDEVKSVEKYLIQYDYYCKGKSIGITYNAGDLSMDQINAFYIIEGKLKSMKKNG